MTRNYDADYLDNDEKELIESVENTNDWQSVENFDKWKNMMTAAAKNTIESNQLLYLHLPKKDLDTIKAKSIEEGVSYQYLLTNLIHNYLAGNLVEK
jgi:predicted DNA binding CopG/RHH family protein